MSATELGSPLRFEPCFGVRSGEAVIASQLCQGETGKPGPGVAMEGRLVPASTTTVLQGTLPALTYHIRCYQSLTLQRARWMQVQDADLAPTAGETQAVLRASPGPDWNQRRDFPAGGLAVWKGLFGRTC